MDTTGPDRIDEAAAAAARAALPEPDDTEWETVRPEVGGDEIGRDDLLPGGVHQVPAVAAVGGDAAIALAVAGAVRRWRSRRRAADTDAT
jgi:hypothetical protein